MVTNIDNVIIMVLFSASHVIKRIMVALGYLIAMLIMLVLIYIIATLAVKVIPLHYVRDFGILPILVGVYNLTKTIYRRVQVQTKKDVSPIESTSPLEQILFSITTQLACSVDLLAVFVPELMKHKGDVPDLIFLATFTVMIALITIFVIVFGRFLKVDWLERFADYAVPVVLMLVGLYVLYF